MTPSPAHLEAAQRSFSWLIPFRKNLLTTGEAAAVLGREADFVRALIEDGKLEAHSDTALGQRKSSRVTRRSVLLRLLVTANYRGEDFLRHITDLMESLDPDELQQMSEAAAALRKLKLSRQL